MEIILCLILTLGRLAYESYQKWNADRYADMVVRKYAEEKARNTHQDGRCF